MRKTMRTAIGAGGLALLAACGGGGGGSSTPFADGGGGSTIDVPEGVCGSDLYREIIGTYRGRVSYDRVLEDGSLAPYCVWDMTARVIVDADVIGCELDLVTESTVEQPVVLDASSSAPFECIAENDRRDLYDPNGRVQPEDLPLISFPLDFDYEFGSAPAIGPYFGDLNTQATYVRLLDGSAAVVAALRFDGDAGLSLIGRGAATPFRLNGDLMKEDAR